MTEQPILDISFTYDYETYKRFILRNAGVDTPVKIILVYSLCVLGMILSILYLETYSTLIVTLCSLAIIMLTLIIFVIPPIQYKKAKDILEANNRLVFYESHLYGESANSMLGESGVRSYDLFNKFHETTDAFYLFLKSGPAYIVAKKYLNKQQVVVLHDFLMRRFGMQYKYIK